MSNYIRVCKYKTDRFMPEFNPYSRLQKPTTPYQQALHKSITTTAPKFPELPPEPPRPCSRWIFPKHPDRALEAIDMSNDFYISPTDWNHKKIIYAPRETIFIYDPASKSATPLGTSWPQIASVKWNPQTPTLLSTHEDGSVHLLDLEQETPQQTYTFTSLDVLNRAIAWQNAFSCTIADYSELKRVDTRKQKSDEFLPLPLDGRIDGIDWDCSRKYCAVSSSSGIVRVYDVAKTSEVFFEYSHTATATVKALQWSPDGTTIASGGGTSDQMLFIAKPFTQTTYSVKTHAQVCSLIWMDNSHLITGRGFHSTSRDNLCAYKLDQTGLTPLPHPSRQGGRINSIIKDPRQGPGSLQYGSLSTGSNEDISSICIWTATTIKQPRPFAEGKSRNYDTIR